MAKNEENCNFKVAPSFLLSYKWRLTLSLGRDCVSVWEREGHVRVLVVLQRGAPRLLGAGEAEAITQLNTVC